VGVQSLETILGVRQIEALRMWVVREWYLGRMMGHLYWGGIRGRCEWGSGVVACKKRVVDN
jgi:hypothetical protein